ncbi:MAG: bifunctional aspartate kinase/homoserine dehydrogenase I [Bacteroidales bacterium]|nr:bifunctional aspartate kinase/homoserine dehydrogenase I [Bacteroidales bacterium]MBN2764099.1 bifunctional aspartate kinase/homoserine dehydrogenase I [Bacteroidales bacterium]
MKVLKFGGTSIGTAGNILRIKKIIENQQEQVIIVISALYGVTDKLIELCTHAAAKDQNFFRVYNEIEIKHLETIKTLFEEPLFSEVQARVNSYLKELSNIINGIYLLNDVTPKIQDKVLSFGEIIASYIISKVIENAELVDAKGIIKTDSSYGKAEVNMTLSTRLIRSFFKNYKKTAIVPGFIASNEKGDTTTLGRGGSDYTAAIIAAALEAERLEIWTHVDGFMTADPDKVKKAFAIEHLSYAEAMELSHFGAEVIYTPTIQPAYQKNIDIAIKNTFNPEFHGTVISKESKSAGVSMIKGISSIDEIDLITLMGPGMVGVRGISSRLFGTLAENHINIVLITQASSEYTITFAVNPVYTDRALKALEHQFESEIKLRNELVIRLERELSIIAIVGERMKNTPGISANLFTSLGRNGISVIATAQGSSELNISIVIKKESLRKALNVIHEGFFLSHDKELHLFLAGVGTVGGNLLKQINAQHDKLLKDHHLKINVIGISSSKKMLLNPDGISLDKYRDEMEKQGEKADIELFVQKMNYLNFRNSVFIDCTADASVTAVYKNVLSSFVSVVTANKIACSSEYVLYKELKETAQEKNVRFTYETNVGAGLPIISTLNDLIRSGDKIIRLEAVLSGTLNFIFNTISEKVPLSQAIKMALENGYSEPDPRIDLSGTDVRRKLLILSREAGYEFESSDISIKPFLPAECFEGTLDDFWQVIQKYDGEFEERRRKLVNENKKMRYVARLDNGRASIELMEVDFMHPAYPLEGSNNIILITTDRYHEQPMVIRGYGAGAEVTAAGVFADIIRVANV